MRRCRLFGAERTRRDPFPNFRSDFQVFASETGFEFDIREFESFCGSQPVPSPYRTSVRQKCLRYFRRLAPENRSLSCGICSNSTFIRDFLRTVSNNQFSISEIRPRRLGLHLAETGSMSAIRRRSKGSTGADRPAWIDVLSWVQERTRNAYTLSRS
jgi:hypothetical protein